MNGMESLDAGGKGLSMRKLLVGIFAAVIVVAGGGYFGWELLAQYRTKSEVEALFESLRSTFPTATHDRVELTLKTGSVKIFGVVLQSANRATTLRIGQIVATETRGPAGGRVWADRIEFSDLVFNVTLPTPGAPTLSYQAPSIVVENFSGPAALPAQFNSESMIDIARAALGYMASSDIARISLPTLKAKVLSPPNEPPSSGAASTVAEYVYNDLSLRGIGGGRIAEITVERATLIGERLSPELGSVAGAMARLSLDEVNLTNLVAVLDPARENEDAYLPIYRRAGLGLFEVRYAVGGGMQIDEVAVEEVAIRPSKLSTGKLLALAENTPRTDSPPTPDQSRAVLEQVAALYEGIRIGKFEMRGLRVRMSPEVNFNLGGLWLHGLENGRLAEFAMQGMEGKSPRNEPVRLGLFALRGLRISDLLRRTARLAGEQSKPSPDAAVEMLWLLEGIEVRDLHVALQDTRQGFRVEQFRLSWGNFVGQIPSAVRFTVKTTLPTDLTDMKFGGVLSDTGFASITTRLEFNIAWDETSQTLSISPLLLEVDHAFTVAAEFALRNVPRSAFTTDQAAAKAAIEQYEAGPLQIVVRDAGAVRTALAHYAKNKNLSVDQARREIIESVNELGRVSAQNNPQIASLAQALVRFIETPGATLTLRLTPKGTVKFKQLIESGNAQPAAVVTLFDFEAKTAP
jgi:hypothetical protein